MNHRSTREGVETRESRESRVIHDDAQRPRTVYRLEDDEGRGPYQASVLPERMLAPSKSRPHPADDFSAEHWAEIAQEEMQFAFLKRGDIRRWFGPRASAILEVYEFYPREVLARKVILSKSGRQVAFMPVHRELP